MRSSSKRLRRKLRFQRSSFLICILIVSVAALTVAVWQQHAENAAGSLVHERTDEPLTPRSRTPIAQNAQTSLQPSPSHDYTIPPVANGLAPVVSSIPTKEPVVFLGIDDGAYKQPFELQLMAANNIHASLFLANRFIQDDPLFFKNFTYEGSRIENHTLDHKLLSQLSYQNQVQEICGEANLELQQFGYRPILFRPPGGDYNLDTERAAATCGMRAVVMWVAKANGGSMQYQIGHSLRPGDVVLMHFRPEFQNDMNAFLAAERAAGLHTELLENWLQ